MFRIRERGLRLAIMREVALYYRTRPGSLTQSVGYQDEKRLGTLGALRLSIGRRRNAGLGLDLPRFTGLVDK